MLQQFTTGMPFPGQTIHNYYSVAKHKRNKCWVWKIGVHFVNSVEEGSTEKRVWKQFSSVGESVAARYCTSQHVHTDRIWGENQQLYWGPKCCFNSPNCYIFLSSLIWSSRSSLSIIFFSFHLSLLKFHFASSKFCGDSNWWKTKRHSEKRSCVLV